MEERHLNFNNFLQQRAGEISRLSEALRNRTSKRTHQSLPKSVRRRAMSHNRYRIPLKMRRLLVQELTKAESMQRIPKCRKSIRKKHRLIASYRQRSGTLKWLSSHLWSAKRMRMRAYCGFKIAETPNNKSFRSAYRHFRHNACLVDCSYFYCLTISCNSSADTLPPQLQMPPDQVSHNQKFYEGSLVDVENSSKLICPVLVFFQSSFKIRCMFDPICLNEVQSIKWMPAYHIQIGKTKTELYLLLGPQSCLRIEDTLTNLGIIHQFNGEQAHLRAADHRLYYIGPTQPQELGNTNLVSKPIEEKLVEGYSCTQNKKARKAFYDYLQKRKQKKPEDTNVTTSHQFWNFYENLHALLEKEGKETEEFMISVTTRSKYTHKRRNKLTQEQKRKVLAQESQKEKAEGNKPETKVKAVIFCQEQIKNIENIPICQNKKEEPIASTARTNEYDPMMIAPFQNFKSKQQMFQGCFLLCSARNRCQLWRQLSLTNVKVIGRKEMRHLYFEASIRFYPHDFPETLSFETYNKKRAIDLIDAHRRLPPQKRANFLKLNSPFPFYFNVPKNCSQLVPTKISMVSRGNCVTGSYICRLKPEDFQAISGCLERQGVIKHIAEQREGEETDIKSSSSEAIFQGTYEEITSQLSVSMHALNRTIIGFITYGGFTYSESKEGGVGYLFGPLQTHGFVNQQYVLIRKPTSRYYFLGIANGI